MSDLLAEWNACAGETLVLNPVNVFESLNDVGIWVVLSRVDGPLQILNSVVVAIK